MKRFLAVLMAVMMTATLFAVPAFAAGEYVNDADKEGVAYTLGVGSWMIDYANPDTTAPGAIATTADASNYNAGSGRYGLLYKMILPDVPAGKTIKNAEFRMSTYYTSPREIRYMYKFPDNLNIDTITSGEMKNYVNPASYGAGEYYLGAPVTGTEFASGTTYRCGLDVTNYVNECIANGQEYVWIIATRNNAVKAYRHDYKGFEAKLFYEYADAESFGAVSQTPSEGATDVYPLNAASVTFNNDIVSATVLMNGTQVSEDAVSVSGKTVTVSCDFGKSASIKLDITATDISSQTATHTINFTTASKYAFYDDSDKAGADYILADGSWILTYDAAATDTTAKAAVEMDKSAENHNVGSKIKAAVYKVKLPEIPSGMEIDDAEFRMSSYYSSARAMLYSYKMPGDDWDMDNITIADAQALIDGNSLGTGSNSLSNCKEDESYATTVNYRNRYDVSDYVIECIANGQEYMWIAVTRHNTIKAYRHDVSGNEAKLFYTFKEAGELTVTSSSPEYGATAVYPKGTASVTFSNTIISATASINGVEVNSADVSVSGKTVNVNYNPGLNVDTTITVIAKDISNKTIKHIFSFTTDSKYAYYNDSDMEGVAYTAGEGTWILNYDAEAEDTTVKAATVPAAKSNFNIIKYRDAVVYKMKLPEVPEGKRVAMAEFRSAAYFEGQRFVPYAYKMPGNDWNMDEITIADAQLIINGFNIGNGSNYLATCSSDASYYDGAKTNRCKYDVTDYVNECIRNGQGYVWIALTQIYTIKPFTHDYGSYYGTKLFYTLEDAPEEELIIERPKLVGASDANGYYDLLTTRVSAGDTIKGVSYMKNTTPADKELYVAVAQYNGDKLVSVALTPYTLKADSEGSTVSFGELTVDGSATTVKTFIWNENLSDYTKHDGTYVK